MKDKDTKLIEEVYTNITEAGMTSLGNFLKVNKINKPFKYWEQVLAYLGDTFHTKSDVMMMLKKAGVPKSELIDIIDMKEYQDLEIG